VNFRDDVMLKLYNECIRRACELEDCQVIVEHDHLYYPSQCDPVCRCRKDKEKEATEKTGYEPK